MHVSLYVSDLARTLAFYEAYLGCPADKVRKGYAKWVLETPALVLSFVENPSKVQAQFGHLGFQVQTNEQLLELKEAAVAKGLSIREEIGTACCFAVQDKFWVSDPDGYQWETYVFHADAEFNDPHFAQESAAACCMPATPVLHQPSVEVCKPGSGCC